MTTALLLALLPAVGNIAGGVLAELTPASAAWRNWTLHAAVGVVLGVVAIEIMPEAVVVLDGWQIAAAFVSGGLFYVALNAAIENRVGDEQSTMWMIYVAVAADLFGDGLMIGAGSTIGTELAVALAVGQVLADVPEGAASIITFRSNDVGRRSRLLLSLSFTVFALAGAVVSYLVLRNQSDTWQLAGLVATAGLLSVAVIEDMVRDAHEAEPDTRTSTFALLAGFGVFALVSAGLS